MALALASGVVADTSRGVNPATAAVVLARGLGTRMRRADPGATLDPGQQAAAAAGLKVMIPDAAGRPFLDHILTSLADAGIIDVVLVTAPDHTTITNHLASHPPQRVRVAYAVQAEPRGTADAVLAAEPFVGRRPFLVLNADNLYPIAALEALINLGESGVVGFDRQGLLADGNIPAERIRAFALLDVAGNGRLVDLIEKPDAGEAARFGDDALVSMNLWRLDAWIFDACRAVPLSPRGELELPQAVALAVRQGQAIRVVSYRGGVLDLSSRGDVATVAERLATKRVDT